MIRTLTVAAWLPWALLAAVLGPIYLPWVFAHVAEMVTPTEEVLLPLALYPATGCTPPGADGTLPPCNPVDYVVPGGEYRSHARYKLNRTCRAVFARVIEWSTEAGTRQTSSSHHGSVPLNASPDPYSVGRPAKIPEDALPGTFYRLSITGEWDCWGGLPGTKVLYRYRKILLPVHGTPPPTSKEG